MARVKCGSIVAASMPTLDVSLACEPTDRTQAVLSGELGPGGIDLQPVPLGGATATRRMVAHGDFDAAEVSLAAFLATADRTDPPFVGLPVFPARSFVHSRVFAAPDAGIDDLSDLAGARVGIPETPSSTALWVSGVLADDHGVGPDDVSWFHASGTPPGDVDVEPLSGDRTVEEALEAGDLDAVVAPEAPAGTEPLYDDPRAVEREYYRESGHFPVMTTVVVDADLYDEHPWVAQELYKAFDAAKDRCLEAIDDPVGRAALPWLRQEVAETRALMGEDYWPYGVDANEDTLETVARYAAEQGVTARRPELDELFAPETFEAFKV
jgi:4,5-dihydroxyphthalate decarboxylase